MINTRQFEDSFGVAQSKFDNQIDAPDLSRSVVDIASTSVELLGAEKAGFRQVEASPADVSRLVGKILLMPNGNSALSPVIFGLVEGEIEITMIDLPYDPSVGLSDGLHFGLSAKAQSRVNGFGGHSGSGGFEAGHFSTVLAASSAGGKDIARELENSGDKATHSVLEAGVVETMAHLDMIAIPYKTRRLPSGLLRPLAVYWHPSLEDDNGMMAGDFPHATQLLLGAGVAAIGTKGLDRAERLVDTAVRGS